jgi:hypothetical protein
MRRPIETCLAVALLVVLPLCVALVARSEPKPVDGLALPRSGSPVPPVDTASADLRCVWTHHHTDGYCTFTGGSCTLYVPRKPGGFRSSVCVLLRNGPDRVPPIPGFPALNP